MNLADYFQPLEPPPNGLQTVRRRARTREVKRKLASGGALLLLPFVFVGAFAIAQPHDNVVNEVTTVTTAHDPVSGSVGITQGNIQITGISPDANGLPGSSVAVTVINTTAWVGIPVLLLILTIAGSLWRTRRKETPQLRFGWLSRVFLFIATAWLILAVIVAFVW